MKGLHVLVAKPGLRVLWDGSVQAADVLDPTRVATGQVLVHHHPGIVATQYGVHHLTVTWLGIEDEPASFAVGHNPNSRGYYPFLVVPTQDEWNEALAKHWSQHP